MPMLPWKKKEALPEGTIRYYIDAHYGFLEEPFGKASRGKQIFVALTNIVGIADLALLAVNFWRGSYDWSDWLTLATQLVIAVLYFTHLWNKTNPFNYYQLSPEQFEIKKGFFHKKVKVSEIVSIVYKRGDFFDHTRLDLHMKTGKVHKLLLTSMFKADREKIEYMVATLQEMVSQTIEE